jgi:hypothetical protein
MTVAEYEVQALRTFAARAGLRFVDQSEFFR